MSEADAKILEARLKLKEKLGKESTLIGGKGGARRTKKVHKKVDKMKRKI